MKSNVTSAGAAGVAGRTDTGADPVDAAGSALAEPWDDLTRDPSHGTGDDADPGTGDASATGGTARAVGLGALLSAGGRRTPVADGREATRHEALVLGTLAVASLPAVWIAQGRPTAWVAVAALALGALSALSRRTAGGSSATFGRGCVALTSAALLAVSAPDLAAVAAVWSVAAVGVLTTRLPGDTGWLLTAAGGGMLAVLETVLAVMAEPLGAGDGPAGLLLAGAAATIATGTAGGAVAQRLATSGPGWTHAPDDEDDAPAPGPVSEHDASSDRLTGLGTRAALLRGVTRALARADVMGGRVALFVVAVDRFDALTEAHGERGGEAVLRHLARRLRAVMPAEDVVARVGDTTFAILVEGVGPDGRESLARRMAALVEEPMLVGGATTRVTCSIGTAVADGAVDTPERLLRAASGALRGARAAGRGRWAHHDPALGAHDTSRDRLEADLRDAVAEAAVGVVVQPVVDLGVHARADRTAGVEVMAHWVREGGTVVPTQHVVAIAEELGIGVGLGSVVLDRALDLMAGWREAEQAGGPQAPRYVAVNLSRSQLEDAAFATSVSARLADRGLDPACLSVEVSAVAFVDTEQARRTLGMLRSLGVGVTVDDFGRGALGLLALRQLPVDTVKVDRQVTADLGRDDTVLATVLTLCRAMGRRCVVDGVESTAQLEAARRLGVDAAQGFLLGRPVAPAVEPPRPVA